MRAWSLPLRLLVALVLVPAVAACPCMDGLPAMGHNPFGDMVPERIEPRPGCQATPSERDAGDGSGRVVVAQAGFDGDPAGDDAWFRRPAGDAGVAWTAGAATSGPRAAPPDAAGLYLRARADGREWAATATFRMGDRPVGQEDQPGTGGWTFRFLAVAPDEATMRELPSLRVDIDKREGRGYAVDPPAGGPTGLVVTDTSWHTLEVRQEGGAVKVLLDGNLVSTTTTPLTRDGECLHLGLSGPGGPKSDEVRIDEMRLATLPNEAAIQLLRYKVYREPALPVVADGLAPCATPSNSCCFIDPISENYGGYPCAARCNHEDGAYAVDEFEWVEEEDAVPVVRMAMDRTYAILGCHPDPVGKSRTATLWTAGPDRNEVADRAAWPANGIRYTDTDTVMYDENGRTRFSCDLIGGRLLLQMEYTDEELAEAGLAPADLVIHHWDGQELRVLADGARFRTGLGNLTVDAAGNDVANRTAWVLLRIEDRVEGRRLNNNFATVAKGEGLVEGNGYLLGPPVTKGTPAPGLSVALVLLASAALLAARRTPG